jgi:23S rRNA (guanosine2251-2'-O)-methyltransferase
VPALFRTFAVAVKLDSTWLPELEMVSWRYVGLKVQLVLDGVTDPQNLGAILRTAEAAGAHGLILPRDRAAGVTPAAVRASAGATEHLPVARVTNLAAFLDWVKGQGLWVVGADPTGGRLLYSADLKEPLALVIGAEGRGLRPLVRSRCDVQVRIPLSGRVASLNASCAAAVCVFEVIRQRHMTERGSD